MLQIHFMHKRFALSDPATEEVLHDIASMRHFAEQSLAHDRVPDETTILHFRHLLERYNCQRTKFDEERD